MNTVAIITARGGSRRIPKKNIKEFCGKPIIIYSIEAALSSGIFDEIMVSTDSQEIADIAVAAGAKVPFMRSADTSDDFATTRDVLLEVLHEYRSRNRFFDYMFCIYPTAPFVTPERLQTAFRIIDEKKCSEIIPVVRFSYPPQRAYVLKGENIQYKWNTYRDFRSQDLEPFYHDAGQFYCYNVKDYLASQGNIENNIVPIFLSEYEVQDIDDETDWKIAEVKYKLIHEEKINNKK